jgi:hypothetical protein
MTLTKGTYKKGFLTEKDYQGKKSSLVLQDVQVPVLTELSGGGVGQATKHTGTFTAWLQVLSLLVHVSWCVRYLCLSL